MRQVPYCIVGLGRLGRHIAHYLSLLGINHVKWTRVQPSQYLQDCLSRARVCLLCIPDDVIDSFIQNHICLDTNRAITWVHFSGALDVPGVYGLHPLMTFTDTLLSLEAYQQIPLIVTKHTPATLLADWPNPRYTILADQKALYHAWCVLAGNGTTVLWQQFHRFLSQTLGVPDSVAKPYCQQIMTNLLVNPVAALTGPWAREDQNTVAKHQTALAGHDAQALYQALYQLFRSQEML